MAKNLTYIANHDGNRKWILDRFEDSCSDPDAKFIYLCQLRDSDANTRDIIVIPRSEWPKLVESINEALKEFK